MPELQDPFKIRGEPTKELFIEMLTRDIGLFAAIIDLVDNSTDGARRLRPNGEFDGLSVRIELDGQRFKIADNCGGIPVELAREYAFRFGRAPGMEATPHSVGQFGVGMKRAIFKMGHRFRVESKTAHDAFVVDQDIRTWATEPTSWDFRFSEVSGEGVPEPNRGTTVIVSDLREDVSESFSSENWRTKLRLELRTRLQESITQGLAVTLNRVPISADPLTFLSDESLAPVFTELQYDESAPPVHVKLWCGLGPSEDAALAGWHVFCNGRLVLESDKSEVTGWGTTAGARMPRFHPQYNHFRGYVFFDCDDAARLPWNTTKTGVDVDSPIYRATRQRMGLLARPVIDFLNSLKTEKERRKKVGRDDPGPLEAIVQESGQTPLKDIRPRDAFVSPTVPALPPRPETTSIQYYEAVERVRAVKKALKVTTNKDVGLKTFEYFYKAEVEQ